jgi:hypothetical protein
MCSHVLVDCACASSICSGAVKVWPFEYLLHLFLPIYYMDLPIVPVELGTALD